jgi:hypothetical protein
MTLSVDNQHYSIACHYAKFRYAECRDLCYSECHGVECRYDECRYVECCYAECRGAVTKH